VTRNADLTTVVYNPAGLLPIGKRQPYELTWRGTGQAATSTNAGAILANYLPETPDGAFWIEAEDFDNGGSVPAAQAAVNTMPYAGGAFDQLTPTPGVDYARSDAVPDGDVYRINEAPNVPLGGNQGAGTLDLIRTIRGGVTFESTVNYAIGWAANGNWQNYTRTVPAGTYQIWAGTSYGGGGSEDVRSSVQLVTSGVGTPTQTTQNLGFFRAPGTGGWGTDELVPLRATAVQNTDAVEIPWTGGSVTLRWSMESGDVDYLMLIPVTTTPVGPEVNTPTISGGNITVTWSGGGQLYTAPVVTGPWTGTGDSDGSFSEAASTTGNKFYQIRP
jgi:hypothetical protein